jgi:hypothetical protein
MEFCYWLIIRRKRTQRKTRELKNGLATKGHRETQREFVRHLFLLLVDHSPQKNAEKDWELKNGLATKGHRETQRGFARNL